MCVRPKGRAVLLQAMRLGALLALIGSPFAVQAAEHPKKEHAGKMPQSMAQLMNMSPEECMKMMDKEHKGHVTKAEFMKFHEELWQRMDRNRDGRADHAEFTDAG